MVGDVKICLNDDPLLDDERWLALPNLLPSEWFSGTWFFQETGVARDLVVLYGIDGSSYQGLMRLLRWISRCAPKLLNRYSISYTSIHTQRGTWTASWWSVQDYKFSAIDLLSRAKELGCIDPRDQIYAFLGHPLLRTADDKPILMPKYDKDYTELGLCTAFTKSLLRTNTGIQALSAIEPDGSHYSRERCAILDHSLDHGCGMEFPGLLR